MRFENDVHFLFTVDNMLKVMLCSYVQTLLCECEGESYVCCIVFVQYAYSLTLLRSLSGHSLVLL